MRKKRNDGSIDLDGNEKHTVEEIVPSPARWALPEKPIVSLRMEISC
jgi:hypothetical protein